MLPISKSTVITAEHVSIGYDQHAIIHDFNAEVSSGEFIAILGSNGAGKTTLLKTLLGLIKPIAGQLKIIDHDPHQGCIALGYMPQQIISPELYHIHGRTLLSASLQANQWGLPHLTKNQKEQINYVLHQVEAEAFADKPFGDCSGGQQRRIMLAQALLGQPRILLLDEPLANLDLRHQENFMSILKRLNVQHQVTILMTSHEINPIMHALSRVLYLANGHALLGPVAEVFTSQSLTDLYQTPIEVIQHQGRYFVHHAHSGKEIDEAHHHNHSH